MDLQANKAGIYPIYQKPAQAIGLSTPAIGCGLDLPGLPGGGNKIYDRSPYGNIGAITGATWKRLPSGLWYLDFDGTDDYVDCGNFTPAGDADKQLTVLYWWKGATGGAQIICQRDRGENQRSFYVGATTIKFAVNIVDDGEGATGHTKFYSNDVDYTDSIWRQFGFTFDGNLADTSEASRRLRMFLNGARIAESSLTLAADDDITTVFDSNAQVLIAAAENNGVKDNFAEGSVALLRIYNRALSALEIQDHYQQEKHLFGVW